MKDTHSDFKMSSLTYTLYTLLHWRIKFFLLIVHMNYFFTFWCKWRNWYCTTLHGNRFHNERREYPYNVIFVCLTETARYVIWRQWLECKLHWIAFTSFVELMVFLSLLKNYKYAFDSCLQKKMFFLYVERQKTLEVHM